MSGSNFSGEIKDAMLPKSSIANKNLKGSRPPPMSGGHHNGDAVAKPPPPPHQFHPPQPQAEGQQGLQQAAGIHQAVPHMGGPTMQQGGGVPTGQQPNGLQQAHATIVNALAQRDRGI